MLDGGQPSTSHPGHFVPRKASQYPLNRRLSGTQSQSWFITCKRMWIKTEPQECVFSTWMHNLKTAWQFLAETHCDTSKLNTGITENMCKSSVMVEMQGSPQCPLQSNINLTYGSPCSVYFNAALTSLSHCSVYSNVTLTSLTAVNVVSTPM